jgi:PTS system nitrogen regulatory IIA component
MQLADFLDFDAIKTALPGGNKRSLFKQLADLSGLRVGVGSTAVLASLNERERLGSTGFGLGVAIPHAKVEGLEQIYGLFAR